MPEPFQWSHVSELLDEIMALPSQQRASFIDASCKEAELRDYLHSLVLSYDDSTSFLENSPLAGATEPVDSTDEPFCVGRRVGPYQLIEEIGSGGMGVVYRAIRADDHYLKTVAIKLMRSDLGSRLNLTRFRVERQVMASLDHPNVARLLDGGTSAEGLPYLVMELIDGQPLDVYCDRHRLSITDRLKLFRFACSAVHYAHQHLVIHRDLKPANVLVTETGTVKLLDFGIAKILDPESFPQIVDPTVPLMRLLSPDYASPEQIRGDLITTASDVYSLGVLLYQLLAGRKPYSFNPENLVDLTRLVCETEPPRPSVAVGRSQQAHSSPQIAEQPSAEAISALRSTQPGKLRRRLEGDLDNIVMKALRKEPGRRYRSVEQLSEDIQRHLDGLPVTARSDTFGYRAAKFVRRHKAFVTSAALITLSLVIAMTLTWREAQVAKAERALAVRRFNDVRNLARSNLFDLLDTLRQLPGSAPAQHIAIRNALNYLDRLNTETAGDRDLMADLGNAYEKIGDIQGTYSGSGIGDSRAALGSYRKAFALDHAVAESSRDDPRAITAEISLMQKFVRCLMLTGNTAEASAVASKAEAIAQRVVEQHPHDIPALIQLAHTQLRSAYVLGGSGTSTSTRQLPEAIDNERRALDILTRSALPNDTGLQLQIAQTTLMLGFHLSKERRFEDAHRAIDSAISMEEAQAGDNRATLLHFYNTRGLLFERMGDQRQALSEYRRSLPLARALAAADPGALDPKLNLAISMGHVAMQQGRLGHPRSGVSAVEDATSVIEQMYRADPTQSFYLSLLTVAYSYQAELLSDMGDQDKALALYRKALECTEEVSTGDPTDLESRLSAAKLHIALGAVLARNRQYTAAQSELTGALTRLAELLKLRPFDAEAISAASAIRSSVPQLAQCKDRTPCGLASHLQLPTLIN